MATASTYVARRCGDEDAAAAAAGMPCGPGVAGVVAVNVVFGDVVFGDVVDDFVDFDFKVWRSLAKARRK
jgi:hypothetical protein